MGDMNPNDLAALVESAAEKGTNRALIKLGFNPEDFQEHQRDAAFTRQQRLASEQVTKVVRRTMIGLAFTGLISLLTVGVQHALDK